MGMGMGLCCCGDDDPPPPSSSGSVSSFSNPPALCSPCGTNPQTYVPTYLLLTTSMVDGTPWASPTFQGTRDCSCHEVFDPRVQHLLDNPTMPLQTYFSTEGQCVWVSECSSQYDYTTQSGDVCDGMPATVKEINCVPRTIGVATTNPNPKNYYLASVFGGGAGNPTFWIQSTGIIAGTPPLPKPCTPANRQSIIVASGITQQNVNYSCNPFYYEADWWVTGSCCIGPSATENNCCRKVYNAPYYKFHTVVSAI